MSVFDRRMSVIRAARPVRAAPTTSVETNGSTASSSLASPSSASSSIHASPRYSRTVPDRFEIAGAPSDPADRLGLFDALAPLVTDAFGSRVRENDDADAEPNEFESDPFQGLVADIAIQRSREEVTSTGDGRRALLRAVAELAETHAVAADLACETTAIDLPLDVPDPIVTGNLTTTSFDASPTQSMRIVPDMIRTCRDRLAAHTSAEDRTRIDIVAALFDHVLADDRLTPHVRNTLARLQLPVLRMALADDSFFQSRTHPTRRLLDRLAASAVEWNNDTEGGRTAVNALERVVHTVIRGSFEDAGEHARLLEQFERAIVDIATAASAAPVVVMHDSEDRDVLVIKTTIQISQLLAGVEVDRAVRFFMLDVWSRVLVEIACRQPDSGRDALLARAKRLCFDLAWTAAPKTTSGERARLAGLLPTMIAAIRDGLRVIDYPEADERAFFGEWTRVLAYAVRGAPGGSLFRASEVGINGLGIDVFAKRLREGSFGPETITAAGDGRPTETAIGLRTVDDVTPSMLRAASVTDTANGPATIAPIVITELRKGEWFDLRESHGFVRVRLSWVSPLRSFYLFIGADSALTRSLDPAGIQSLVMRGDLRRAPKRRDD
jgi:Protein of unknown function (DUF1631)